MLLRLYFLPVVRLLDCPGDGDTAFRRAIWTLLMVKVPQSVSPPCLLVSTSSFIYFGTADRVHSQFTFEQRRGRVYQAVYRRVSVFTASVDVVYNTSLTGCGGRLCPLSLEGVGRSIVVPLPPGRRIQCDENTTEITEIPTRPGQFRSLKLALITATCIYLLLTDDWQTALTRVNDARHALLEEMSPL